MSSDLKKALLRHLKNVEEQFSLQALSPLQTGGVADYYTEATSAVEVAAAVKAAIDVKIPYCVIGQGSRTLFSDGGYPGLVIRNKAGSYGISKEASQIIVDAGLSLERFSTLAVSQGLGGMIPLFREQGTIGGALYSGLTQNNFSLLSYLRYMTVIIPPAKIDKEPTINRYKKEWLSPEEGITKLKALKEEYPEKYQPVILTAMFQLTSVRTDELRLRLQAHSRTIPMVKGNALGPIFKLSEDLPLIQMLKALKIHNLKVNTVYPDKECPLYLRTRGVARAQDVRQLISLMAEELEKRYAVQPVGRYEYLGVW